MAESAALYIQRKQIPVGQGCFSSGFLQTADTRFLYIHDCGGTKKLCTNGIKNHILNLPSKWIDALFVSHFDRDHFSGVRELIKHRTIKKVILPKLDGNLHLQLISHCISAGERSSKDYRTYIANPARWYSNRGIDVYEVSIDSQDENPTILDNSSFSDEPRSADDRSSVSGRILGSNGNFAVHGRVNKNSTVREIVWSLKSHVYNGSDKKFVANLRKHFKIKTQDIEKIRNWLLNQADRKKVKDFYLKQYGNDHNLISLCLYSGLRDQTGFYLFHCIHRPWRVGNCQKSFGSRLASGWMHTGDLPLADKSVYKQFISRFSTELDRVYCFIVPHHGSGVTNSKFKKSNFQNVIYGVIPVGSKGQYGHPSAEVIKDLCLNRIVPILVTDLEETFFCAEDEYLFVS